MKLERNEELEKILTYLELQGTSTQRLLVLHQSEVYDAIRLCGVKEEEKERRQEKEGAKLIYHAALLKGDSSLHGHGLL